jgi:hypothetical protein
MPAQTIPADLPSRILGTPVSTEQVLEILTASGVAVSVIPAKAGISTAEQICLYYEHRRLNRARFSDLAVALFRAG